MEDLSSNYRRKEFNWIAFYTFVSELWVMLTSTQVSAETIIKNYWNTFFERKDQCSYHMLNYCTPNNSVIHRVEIYPEHISGLFPLLTDFSLPSNSRHLLDLFSALLVCWFFAAGVHSVPGGVFPMPPAATHLLTMLPPPSCFQVNVIT